MEKKLKLYKKLGATLIDKGIWFLKTAHNVKVKKVITWGELIDVLNKKYKVPRDKIICADGEYHLTDWQNWRSLIEYDWTDKRKYRKAIYDCDNFAGSFSARIAEIYGLNTAGLARGIKIIDATTKKVVGYHRANLIIAIDKGEIKAFGYEPETDGWNELTYNPTQIWNWLYYYNYFEFN